jgi:hypothetical protein
MTLPQKRLPWLRAAGQSTIFHPFTRLAPSPIHGQGDRNNHRARHPLSGSLWSAREVHHFAFLAEAAGACGGTRNIGESRKPVANDPDMSAKQAGSQSCVYSAGAISLLAPSRMAGLSSTITGGRVTTCRRSALVVNDALMDRDPPSQVRAGWRERRVPHSRGARAAERKRAHLVPKLGSAEEVKDTLAVVDFLALFANQLFSGVERVSLAKHLHEV